MTEPFERRLINLITSALLLLHVIEHVADTKTNIMLLDIKEIINSTPSTYRGSEKTRSMIEDQIKERWGEVELKNYDPLHSARTASSWFKLGFKVRRGERALKSITVIETKDSNGNILKKHCRPCFIFYYRQMEQINKTND